MIHFSRIPEARPSLKIIERLQIAGFKAYWVGGCVRDLLLGRRPKDYDIVTDAPTREIERLFPKHLVVGKKFGIFIVTEFAAPVEVATFRRDLDYVDGRRPLGVKPGNIRQDAQRRDFTVNGLFFDPIHKTVIDFVKGREDLRKKRIRAIGAAAKRFGEDHLRMLRAVRFSVQLGFKIEEKTFRGIRRLSGKIKRISAERIREELIRIFSSPAPDKGLRLLSESGLLKAILPEVEKLRGVRQSKKFHPEGDVFTHTARTIKNLKAQDPALVFAGLLHDVEKPACRFTDKRGTHFYGHEVKSAQTAAKIMRRLKFSRDEIEKAGYLIRNHLKWFSAPQMRRTRLEHYMHHPWFPDALELLRADSVASKSDCKTYRFILAHFKSKPSPDSQPKFIRGADLIKMGIKQGPIIGEILKRVEEKRLDEELKTSEEAREWVKKTYFKLISP